MDLDYRLAHLKGYFQIYFASTTCFSALLLVLGIMLKGGLVLLISTIIFLFISIVLTVVYYKKIQDVKKQIKEKQQTR